MEAPIFVVAKLRGIVERLLVRSRIRIQEDFDASQFGQERNSTNRHVCSFLHSLRYVRISINLYQVVIQRQSRIEIIISQNSLFVFIRRSYSLNPLGKIIVRMDSSLRIQRVRYFVLKQFSNAAIQKMKLEEFHWQRLVACRYKFCYFLTHLYFKGQKDSILTKANFSKLITHSVFELVNPEHILLIQIVVVCK